mgnify:CR=1 FL=1
MKEKSLSPSLKRNDPQKLFFEALWERMELYTAISAYNRALDDISSYHKKAAEYGDDSKVAWGLLGLGNTNFRAGNVKKAEEYTLKALSLASRKEYRKVILTCWNGLGNICGFRGDHSKAFQYFKKILDSREGPGPDAATLYNNIAVLHLHMNDISCAEEYIQKAIQASLKIKDLFSETRSRIHLAIIRIKQGNMKEAEEQALRSLKLAEKAMYLQKIPMCLNTLGFILKTRGKYRKALHNFKRSYALNLDNQNLYGQSTNLLNIAEVYLLLGESGPAFEYFKKAGAITDVTGDPAGKVQALYGMGEACRAMKDRKKAAAYYRQALKVSNLHKSLPYPGKAKERLAEMKIEKNKKNI